jgi:hypothetical protein
MEKGTHIVNQKEIVEIIIGMCRRDVKFLRENPEIINLWEVHIAIETMLTVLSNINQEGK